MTQEQALDILKDFSRMHSERYRSAMQRGIEALEREIEHGKFVAPLSVSERETYRAEIEKLKGRVASLEAYRNAEAYRAQHQAMSSAMASYGAESSSGWGNMVMTLLVLVWILPWALLLFRH